MTSLARVSPTATYAARMLVLRACFPLFLACYGVLPPLSTNAVMAFVVVIFHFHVDFFNVPSSVCMLQTTAPWLGMANLAPGSSGEVDLVNLVNLTWFILSDFYSDAQFHSPWPLHSVAAVCVGVNRDRHSRFCVVSMALVLGFFCISSRILDQPTSPYQRTIGKVGTTSGSGYNPQNRGENHETVSWSFLTGCSTLRLGWSTAERRRWWERGGSGSKKRIDRSGSLVAAAVARLSKWAKRLQSMLRQLCR